ncbi:Hypothetical protein POVR2_LOCUS294 [uncultured virus]|nr:Hypothetical protein POVR2_LOCUS294 [uncultured virus]
MNDLEFLADLYATCEACVDDDWPVLSHVGMLLAEHRPHLDLSLALDRACLEGDNYRLARQLLDDSRVDPTSDESNCLVSAVALGRIKTVGCLLADGRADPNTGDGTCLDIAIENGYREIARVLLADTRVDPSLDESKALLQAIHNSDTELVVELLRYSSVRQAARWSDVIEYAVESENPTILQVIRQASGLTDL